VKIAMTGATGFVGAETLAQALAAGYKVNALTRRPQPDSQGITWIEGTLDDSGALEKLVHGADAVIHIAGVVNAPDRTGFEAGNATGTAKLIAAMNLHGIKRLIHVSSLAAREPQLSDYGWSKERAEHIIQSSALDWTMIRPPAIYGGGDRQMLELFVMAKWRIMALPPGGRMSVIEVSDLARLLLACANDTAISLGQIYEVDDGTANGWTHDDFARQIGHAMGHGIVPLPLPKSLLNIGARLDHFFRGSQAKLTQDRVNYFCHPDWVSRADMAPPTTLWQPQISTSQGLSTTVAAYRAKGWI
jgi:uncharacterized protein YbjT (DUF2867 family)